MAPSPDVSHAAKGAASAHLFPHITGLGSVAFLAGIILLFAGVEVHAVHANELENPAKQFPESMFLAHDHHFFPFHFGVIIRGGGDSRC